MSLRQLKSEECDRCGTHPSVWKPDLGGHRNAVVAKWVFCRPCELIDQAHAAGPPSDTKDADGWRLILTTRTPTQTTEVTQ